MLYVCLSVYEGDFFPMRIGCFMIFTDVRLHHDEKCWGRGYYLGEREKEVKLMGGRKQNCVDLIGLIL